MITQSMNIRTSLQDNKENIFQQHRRVVNNTVSGDQNMTSCDCFAFDRSYSSKGGLLKQQTIPTLSERPLNNLVLTEPSPPEKQKEVPAVSLITNDFQDDQTNDILSEAPRKKVYQGLDITVDKPKLCKPLVNGYPNTTDPTTQADQWIAIGEDFGGRVIKAKKKLSEIADKKFTMFYYEGQPSQQPSPTESRITQTEQVRPKHFSPSPVVNLTVIKEDVIKYPVRKDKEMRCILRHQKKSNVFCLYDQYRQPLIVAKKLDTIIKTYVLLTDHSDFGKDTKNYIGKVRSNLIDSSFTAYLPSLKSGVQVKNMIVTIEYASNLFSGDQNKMTVFLPRVNNMGDPDDILTDKQEGLGNEKYKAKVFILHNKVVKEDSLQAIACYKNRASIKSVKNFILLSENGKEQYLLFGKVSQEEFNLDVRYPLSPIQALSVALTRF